MVPLNINTLFGVAGIGSIIAMLWGHIRSWLSRLTSFCIVNCTVHGQASEALMLQFWTGYRKSPFGNRGFFTNTEYIKPKKKWAAVAFEGPGKEPILFWKGWRPIFVKNASQDDMGMNGISVTFIRGMFSIDAMLIDALERYNAQVGNNVGTRFFIRRFSGSTQTQDRRKSHGSSDDNGPAVSNGGSAHSAKPLGYDRSELGVSVPADKEDALKTLVLPESITSLFLEGRHWLDSKNWYYGKNIPWRRGWALYGPPGTGKSSVAKSLAQYLGIPLCVFDVSGMSNTEFIAAWGEAKTLSPCVILIEDVDVLFNQRDNNQKTMMSVGVTFDCFLNCISGVEENSGVFLVITTNDIDKLDEALGKPDASKATINGQAISSRPGRIDRVIYLGPMDDACRHKLVERILIDCPQYIDKVTALTVGYTGAQVQEVCSQIALAHQWKEPINI